MTTFQAPTVHGAVSICTTPRCTARPVGGWAGAATGLEAAGCRGYCSNRTNPHHMFPNKNPKNKLELRSKKAPKTKSKYRLTPIGVSFGPGASFDAVNQRPVSGGVEVKVGTTLGSRGGGGGGGYDWYLGKGILSGGARPDCSDPPVRFSTPGSPCGGVGVVVATLSPQS